MRLGFPEVLVIMFLALLFFGPSKLPTLGKSLGEAIRGLKKGLAGDDEKQPEATAQQLPAQQPTAAPAPAAQQTTTRS
ncbi:MAG: twin-arginine translocase TatA/TatE family subunit [Deltaproteobacteria bacterium]|nr:twin-arginine translocase TatA/TatE family subunit [Deltaproteobacteria bacterium]